MTKQYYINQIDHNALFLSHDLKSINDLVTYLKDYGGDLPIELFSVLDNMIKRMLDEVDNVKEEYAERHERYWGR